VTGLPDPTTAPPWHQTLTAPSDFDVACWLVATSPENRKWWLDRVRTNSREASRCWESDHEERIEQLQRLLAEARARIDWLEKNYCTPPFGHVEAIP